MLKKLITETPMLPLFLMLALGAMTGAHQTAHAQQQAATQQPADSARSVAGGVSGEAERAPNIVIFFTDDLGYGDLGPFGHPTIRTPHLGRMASEGIKLTQFYAAASVCTPSRAGLLTGRLPVRSGTASDEVRVFFPDSEGGLPPGEVTIAEALREEGYATFHVGKWHLGHRPQHLPTSQGFDSYFGVPYSNDMDRDPATVQAALEASDNPDASAAWGNYEKAIYFADPEIDFFDVPLMRDTTIIERPADQHTLNQRYAEEATRFIEAHEGESEEPFFLYFAHNSPHVPLFASEEFQGASRRGLYGDVVEEIDWTVGEVLETLRRTGQAENTLVVFTSDNGPWLPFGEQGGTAGLLRGGKGSTWEGGMRVPAVAWWPGMIPAGSVSPAVSSTMDLFSTALELAGAEPPSDGRAVDGQSLMPVLRGETDEGRETLFYYRGEQLYAARVGPWKAHYVTQAGYGDEPERHETPLLFHLEHDPSEQHNVAAEHPEVLEEIRQVVEEHQANLERGDVQLTARSERHVTKKDSSNAHK